MLGLLLNHEIDFPNISVTSQSIFVLTLIAKNCWYWHQLWYLAERIIKLMVSLIFCKLASSKCSAEYKHYLWIELINPCDSIQILLYLSSSWFSWIGSTNTHFATASTNGISVQNNAYDAKLWLILFFFLVCCLILVHAPLY